MRKSISKVKVESWFIRVEFFCLKNRELRRICIAAVEVPSFKVSDPAAADISSVLWPELFRFHSRKFSKEEHSFVCYRSYEIFSIVDEALDEGLSLLYMPESFLRKHHLFVVG